MVRWLSRFFFYLDPYFIARRSLPPLNDVGLLCFHKLSCYLIQPVIIPERLLTGFKKTLVNNMIKAEECLKREKGRVSHYLHSSTEEKLIEQVQEQLLSKVFQQLLEKEHSGCYALLREDKTEDLTRMYSIFSKIPKGLDSVSLMFKHHVTSEGIPVVNQAEDAANSRKENRSVLGLQEQMFIRKVVALHEKYMLYVTTCFAGHTLFHKALKEEFEVFCNKVIAGSSSSELLSNFSDNILKKGDSEKLDDDIIEDTLDKGPEVP